MQESSPIHQLYSAFQRKDYAAMQACYADDATFSDPVFDRLNADQLRAMWEMFCKSEAAADIEYHSVSADAQAGSAVWVATYRFPPTGRKVVNTIHATFQLRDGKIVKHTDTFSFHRWAAQALGPVGLLLGWTPFLRNKVRGTAMRNLQKFIEKRG